MINPVTTIEVTPNIPEELGKLLDLAYNMRWSWDHETTELFRRMDEPLWVKTNYNPVMLLGSISQDRLNELVQDKAFMNHFHRSCENQDAYMEAETWYQQHYGSFDKPFIAYFSMEFGLTTCFQNYSGGLGVLAGDHMKSASDLGLPLVGVGLLYQEGYFQQYLNQDGYQQESYPINDFSNLPIKSLYDKDGNRLVITVPIANQTLHAYAWVLDVGRVQLYLLDSNHPANSPELRDLTDRLYGGDRRTRIRQEILLGIGGIRLLEALDLRPTIIHMNEGHSAFSALERIRVFMKEHPQISFDEANNILATSSVYTIHTPVSAGLERFGYDLIDEHMPWLWKELGLTREQFHNLGREPMGDYDLFSLPVMALKMSTACNGVSRLHGDVSQMMWQWMFPNVPEKEVPITYVTNGIHVQSWVSQDMAGLFDRYLDPTWRLNANQPEVWKEVDRIPDTELWRTHERRRARLVVFTRNRLRKQLIKRGASQSEIEESEEVLNSEALTIGFARRFATYKRATLLFRDPVRLAKIINNPDRPVQFIFSGKAHPHDQPGKTFIREIVKFANEPEFRHAVVFLENYDMTIARYMVQGVDIWLNNPRRPREASGTSGMKVIYNGGLNLSVLDGWWDEAYSPEVGWSIGAGEQYSADDLELQDYIESQALYNLLENDVVPTFYERTRDGIPHNWMSKIKASMRELSAFFSTDRMVAEYTSRFYIPLKSRFDILTKDNFKEGKEYADWLINAQKYWSAVKVKDVKVSQENVSVGNQVTVEAWIDLGKLSPKDVDVQLYVGILDTNATMIDGETISMEAKGNTKDTVYLFAGNVAFESSGRRGVSVRVIPKHAHLSNPILTNLITWANV